MNKAPQVAVVGLGIILLVVFIDRTKPHHHPHDHDHPHHQQIEVVPAKPTPQRESTFEDALTSITEAELKQNVMFLSSADLEGRMSGKKGNVVAAEWIKKEYERYGLPTMYHKFSIDRVNPGPKKEQGDDFTQNIYAWIEGTDPQLKDEIVVVGAHMDHIGFGPAMSMAPNRREIHPGADDNASGTVALMAVAKAFSMLKDKIKRTVVFQSYSAEEMGLIGSRFYCNNPTFPRQQPDIKRHIFMCNSDMIGYLGAGEFSYGFFSGDSSPDINRYIKELDSKYSFGKRITTQGQSGSDHASFYNKRIPIAFLHTGMHKAYHTPDDTPDKLNYNGIERIAKYTFELIWKVTQADQRPTFNYGGFTPMPYTHDHGHPGVEFYIHKYYKHE